VRIFIDIGHPAHVHYFRNFINIMKDKGHDFFICARDKEMAHHLLKYYGINYTTRGKGRKGLIGKILYILEADLKIYKYAKKFKPDVFLSFSSAYAAHVSKLLGKPHIAFDDTEHAKYEHLLYVPFSDAILTPTCFSKKLGKKQIFFDGYMELCYLNKNYFEPDHNIKEKLGLNSTENYVILRFVSWGASHDIGHVGISIENKIKIVEIFSKYCKVFISSESVLTKSLEKYKIEIPCDKMHDALAYATLLYGESATMASEAAVLGTPAIYIDNDGRGYTNEEEKKYKLVFNFTESLNDQQKSIDKGIELLSKTEMKEVFINRRNKLLSDKINVTDFMVWFVENYPESFKIMKEDPDYQYNFR